MREGHCYSSVESLQDPATLTGTQNNTQQLRDECLNSTDPTFTPPSLVPTPTHNTYAHIIETDFCDWMREGQRQGLDSPQENLPRVQINSTGSVGGSGGPMRDDNNPSEDEVRGTCRPDGLSTKYIGA